MTTARERIEQERAAREAADIAAYNVWYASREAARLQALADDIVLLGGSIFKDDHNIVNCTDASYTIALSDVLAGGLYYQSTYIRMNKATANTVNLTSSLSTLKNGTEISVRQVGAGVTTIVAGSGVVILPVDALVGRRAGSTMTIKKTGTNTWDVIGEMP